MGSAPLIDTGFDLRAEVGGRDPDRYSKTLRRYHQLLWSKPLTSGVTFRLDSALRNITDAGVLRLSSDTIVATYTKWPRPARLVTVTQQAPRHEVDAFSELACTIGAFLVFPLAVPTDARRTHSINQARGIHPRICDRFDLALECIRRHYLDTASPLTTVLARHGDFFDLFGSFRGYVDHFLLNDLVAKDYQSVRFFATRSDLAGDPLPAASVAEYRTYMLRSMDFVRARNDRIQAYVVSEMHVCA
ncbi:MAG: hypothetical protein ABI083_15920 [Lapillicoccus sp.]